MSGLSSLFVEGIEGGAKKVSLAGKSPRNKEELLARRARLLELIAEKKRAFLKTVTDQQAAEEKSRKATARYNDWEDEVEARSKDVRLHEAYIGRLSSQVLELKGEAQIFGRTGEARFASSLITSEITHHRLEQETMQLLDMKAGVRDGNVRLIKLHRRAERAENGLEEARKTRNISIRVMKGLTNQVTQDEALLSGLGWIKENEAEEEGNGEEEDKEDDDKGGEEEEEEEETGVVGKRKDKEREDLEATFGVLTMTEVASARDAGKAQAEERTGVAIGLAKGYAYHWKNVKKTW
ncbi:hypothetical protein MMC22_005021 [Lobaria immixta]|nr:hypothetical protein [Lobaria immixta]